jgi:uncharacterized protein YukE
MPRAVVDPVDLRRFAQALKHFNNELQSGMAALQGQFAGLADTWRDQEHEKFAREFADTMLVINRVVEAATHQIPFLLRKAERIEEYLQQR